MNLPNNVYDKLKFVVQVLIPGFAALYLGLSQVWTWSVLSHPAEVAQTCTVVAVFLGLFLTASAKQYEGAGDLVVTTDPADGETYLHLDPNKHPASFKSKKNVTFNVRQQSVGDKAA